MHEHFLREAIRLSIDEMQAGFDDAQIYDEIPLAPDARSIPTTQALRREALAAFDAWAKQAGRVEY